MARTLISSQTFIGTSLPSSSSSKFFRHGGLYTLPNRRLVSTTVRLSFNEIPPVTSLGSSVEFQALFTKAESLLYTIADAAVAADPAATTTGSTDAAVQKNSGWFGFISEGMEFVLKVTFLSLFINTYSRDQSRTGY